MVSEKLCDSVNVGQGEVNAMLNTVNEIAVVTRVLGAVCGKANIGFRLRKQTLTVAQCYVC